MTIDLSELNFADTADEGQDMVVLHPIERTPIIGNDGEPITIRLVGHDSDVYIKEVNKNRDQNIDEIRRRAKYSSAADDYKGAKLLARCTLGWHGIPQTWVTGVKSKDMADFSYENALSMYNNRGVRWLREQVDEFIAERANFLKASSKT